MTRCEARNATASGDDDEDEDDDDAAAAAAGSLPDSMAQAKRDDETREQWSAIIRLSRSGGCGTRAAAAIAAVAAAVAVKRARAVVRQSPTLTAAEKRVCALSKRGRLFFFSFLGIGSLRRGHLLAAMHARGRVRTLARFSARCRRHPRPLYS